ncbi:fatty acid elongase [Strigomonas culicis]|uniref:Fatty acid elongase n=1 Tax=Strigomonas culicis TaxID=28005 RepID=S9WIY4_9TRYP|nr:fatty acid elongase [Strigomonas culicis]|eukprot:EPY35870.1 fatty acid elongase [Strigomonas culicis]
MKRRALFLAGAGRRLLDVRLHEHLREEVEVGEVHEAAVAGGGLGDAAGELVHVVDARLVGGEVHDEAVEGHGGATDHLQDLDRRDEGRKRAHQLLQAHGADGEVEVHDRVHRNVHGGEDGHGAVADAVAHPRKGEDGDVVVPVQERGQLLLLDDEPERVDQLEGLGEGKESHPGADGAGVQQRLVVEAQGVVPALLPESLGQRRHNDDHAEEGEGGQEQVPDNHAEAQPRGVLRTGAEQLGEEPGAVPDHAEVAEAEHGADIDVIHHPRADVRTAPQNNPGEHVSQGGKCC